MLKRSVISYILSACCLFGVASCVKTLPEAMYAEEPAAEDFCPELRAVINDAPSSKVSSSEVDGDLQPAWELGDKIIAFDQNGNTYGFRVYSVDGGVALMEIITAGSGCGTLTQAPAPGTDIYAVYAPLCSPSDIKADSLDVSLSVQHSEYSVPYLMTAKGTINSMGGVLLSFTNHISVIGLRDPEFPGVESGEISMVRVYGPKVYSEATLKVVGGEFTLTPTKEDDICLYLGNPITVNSQKTPEDTRIYVAVFAGGEAADITIQTSFKDSNYPYRIKKEGRVLQKNCYYYTSAQFSPVPGCLKGRFSVSKDKKVYFSKGNLICDASVTPAAWSFESKQYFVPFYNQMEGIGNTYDNTQIRHFFWSKDSSSRGDKGYGGGRTFYSADPASASDVVDWGQAYNEYNSTSGWFTLSSEQWKYLLRLRGSEKNLIRDSVSIAGISNDYTVIAPDGNTEEIKESYSIIEWLAAEKKGYVCLAPTGFRESTTSETLPCFMRVGANGFYWSSDGCEGIGSLDRAYYVQFGEGPYAFSTKMAGARSKGMAVRLVIE